ncbi:integral membrane protein [Aspergillus sp. HF37]|nr:integral membrane protein [Aspergillus sp. HF37]
MDTDTPKPPLFNYVLSFLLVGVAWGFTTPFIRRAAADFNARQEARRGGQERAQRDRHQGTTRGGGGTGAGGETELVDRAGAEDTATTATDRTTRPAWTNRNQREPWFKEKMSTLFWTVVNLLRTPAYSVPLGINLTGSVWFFLLVGQHELSLTVPLANSSAFLFTVLGEWYVERKVIAKETWLGMALVLAGIGICVQAKN